jgi:hypothetical protein
MIHLIILSIKLKRWLKLAYSKVVNAKFFFSMLVIAFNSSGKDRSLDVLTGENG